MTVTLFTGVQESVHTPKRQTVWQHYLKSKKGSVTTADCTSERVDVLDIDHITPKIFAGLNEYKNLQILYKHCHDTKTTEDNSAVGMRDQHQIIQEPCDRISCTVLQTSDSRSWNRLV